MKTLITLLLILFALNINAQDTIDSLECVTVKTWKCKNKWYSIIYRIQGRIAEKHKIYDKFTFCLTGKKEE